MRSALKRLFCGETASSTAGLDAVTLDFPPRTTPPASLVHERFEWLLGSLLRVRL